jgi:hypothetical protein
VEYFTARNTAILALTQVGVIVAGVLGAGATQKLFAQFNARTGWWTDFVASWGFLALALPIVWAALALWLLLRGEDHEAARFVTFWSGVLVVALLLLVIVRSSAGPLLWFFSLFS